ncbi:AbrB/MazE/SpoVT family DNA-binding domain-containing protein [Bacillus marinisedimentorum]|uniref:AbrB/MazE/SpoVT family DNA-binding domain-containing protein n=1 Tax=Bacillus marinisedimentorum TaxID=1821260 RepID=UPI000871DA08|nr:AbrB/MazE/SpoVT family DNA-binding domain-containing protein [Bacillus marinisedimentorum]
MKSTGIVRKVDELGRVVMPIELRRNLGIKERDSMEIFVKEDLIILKKYHAGNQCLITGKISSENLHLGSGKVILSKEAAQELFNELEGKLKTE